MLFLHGLTADHTMFEKQCDFFSGSYNIVAWDAPAHGKSRQYKEFTYQNAVEVLKQILDKHKINSVIMIGQSMGGYIAQSFLSRYPSMVLAFVAIDTTPYGDMYYSKSDQWWLRQIEWMSRLYPLNAMKKAIAKQVSVSKNGYENMLSMLSPYTKKELCHLMGIGYAGFLNDNSNLSIKCPVMILLGDKDKTGKVQKYNKLWAKNTGFPLILIKNAAHNSNVDNPEAVNYAIEKFIQSL
ncbi:MAG: alpha/beta hydrolase [Ruminococcus flavefaciens]|nr:alpha/beta hydrolase [Ruminococcus flavefaciens]